MVNWLTDFELLLVYLVTENFQLKNGLTVYRYRSKKQSFFVLKSNCNANRLR